MAAGDIHGVAYWPGILCPVYCTYTMGQGISPGYATYRCLPQDASFAGEGTLLIADGRGSPVALQGCKVTRLRETRNESGREWELTIVDRRWRWQDQGRIDLFANQLDPQSKFIPWLIRSPIEIAEACLKAMGEVGYSIDLPVGLTRKDGDNIPTFLPTGINFPPSGVNPCTDWLVEKPALVLQQLAEQFGRRVIWRWETDTVMIMEKGVGDPLPGGSINSRTPSVDAVQLPDGIVVVGSPTRYQADFEVEAVGEEWDGTYRPLSQLSYAPLSKSTAQETRITGTYKAGYDYKITIADATVGAADKGSMSATISDLISSLGGMPAKSDFGDLYASGLTLTQSGNSLIVKSGKAGRAVDIGVELNYIGATTPNPPRPEWNVKHVVEAGLGGVDWSRSPPPLFPGVRATDRLTLAGARALAQKSVWRYYRLTGRDVSAKETDTAENKPIVIPGFGPLKRRQQIVLLDSMCEQIVPDSGDFSIRGRDGSPLIMNQYNGFSRDKPAACIGKVAKRLTPHLYFLADKKNGINTDENDFVHVDFSIDPVQQIIKFSGPVYAFGKALTIIEPTLRLRTACHVRDAETNAFMCFQMSRDFPNSTGLAHRYVYEKHDDVQANVIPEYDSETHTPKDIKLLEDDPILRAGYYLDGMEIRYQVDSALVNVYNGIERIQLDGITAQITWTTGDPSRGAETTASQNYEHNTAVPSYPARRRAENLSAAVKPGGFLGQINDRQDPSRPPPFRSN